MLKVCRLGHATLETPDLERSLAHYVDVFGLRICARESTRAVLCTREGLEVLALEQGSRGALRAVSLQTAMTLDEASALAASAGLSSRRSPRLTPGIDDALVVEDPTGTSVELFAAYRFARVEQTFRGVMPIKLGHVARFVENL